ncbi:FAD dependent oxidoreductase [Dichomitus squalens]|uniref:FAD dependent oxidoreductase n=1 Tax=Dichomitus squalens TaxID=114155 RepID=A0A4Q9NIC0_9APHY|nr:FAD dependent oxidoreductase [Dichomitus squalens]TBU53234.1 FAD dependent oxidoreductase [Dichomitus squalens]
MRSSVAALLIRLIMIMALPVFLNVLAEEQTVLERPVGAEPAPLPVPNPTKSFWIDSTADANPLAKEGSHGALTHDADICIIGSGITGVSAAYHISRLLAAQPAPETPLKVTILEARDFCSGATGRNGGHLTPVAFQEFVEYAALYGVDDAVRAIALEHHTTGDIVKLIRESGKEAETDLIAGGHVSLLFTEPEVVKARADYAAAKAAGVQVDDVGFLTKEEVQQTYGAAYPGFRTPGHNIWPLKLVTHLFKIAKDTGANSSTSSLFLHTNTPVTSVTPSDATSRRWNLTTPRGSIACSYVLHATNAYASHLLPALRGPSGIIPTRGQVIALRAAVTSEEITRTGWGGNEGFEYWFPRPLSNISNSTSSNPGQERNPLVILGGGRESTRPDFELNIADDSVVSPVVGNTLRRFLPAVFPGKYEEGREPEMEWTGIMGYTKTGDPFVGPVLNPATGSSDLFKGQYISAGYTGHGMPRAYGCAEAVAGMIIADIQGKDWSIPDWLPRHHLTQNRVNE